MSEKILCVDDDENILAAYQRQMRKQFQIETALGGPAGLQMLASGQSYAVVISDLRMPEMNGIEFLEKVRETTPDTVRIMLTGNADLEAAAEAVNKGNIFRFLTKPCPPEVLARTMRDGIQQYRLVTAEKELLEKTLKGSVSVMTEILAVLDPQLFGRACFLRDSVREIAKALNAPDTWDLELAAMLAEIGRVTIPANAIAREKSSLPLSAAEKDMLMRVPEIGHRLLSRIPRLEPVAQIVLYQNKHFDGTGFPKDRVAGKQIPLGSRIIRIVADLNQLESRGMKWEAAFTALKLKRGIYDPDILECAFRLFPTLFSQSQSYKKQIRSVRVAELEIGQILLSDVMTASGALLIAAGNRISDSLLVRIHNFARLQNVQEPIKIEAQEPG
ncbi:MAG TPA: HD domain-containing phosphohydrolase [Acidobacteriota bacterium]|nr:HD domain-containing phosphohydrolase [Acidobacteriota bacterium]